LFLTAAQIEAASTAGRARLVGRSTRSACHNTIRARDATDAGTSEAFARVRDSEH
jgi:hypothetical protein